MSSTRASNSGRTGRGRMRRTVAPLVGTALAASILLGGCAESPQNVAVVDGAAITKDQFDQDLAGAREVGQQLSNDQLLSVMIRGEIAAQVAERRGITITDAERDKQLNPAVLNVDSARELAYDLADIQIVAGQLGEDAFAKEISKAKVTVNPRYGTWDPKSTLAVVPGTGSLSANAQNRQ